MTNRPHQTFHHTAILGNSALHRNLACSQMQKGLIAEAISSFTLSLTNGDLDDDGVDPWSSQVTSIIQSLTDKLRLNKSDTVIVDIPR